MGGIGHANALLQESKYIAMHTVQELDSLAHGVLSGIDHFLLNENGVESIIETYIKFCRSEAARRLNISQMPITDEMRLRLRFECLCFSTFCASLQSSKYLTERKWFVKRQSRRVIQLFDGAIATALIELCNKTGMTQLHEITLLSIHPIPKFAFGDHLDPLNRLEEYRAAYVEARGSELERFGKCIGKALDAPNYHLFDVIGGSLATPLLLLTDRSMANVFMSPSGSDDL